MDSYEIIHNEGNEVIIGELNLNPRFNFPNLILREDIDQINLPKRGRVRISVYKNEGPIAHFHITGENRFLCCICIYENAYFNHGLKQSTLNGKQLRTLVDWLKSSNSKDPNRTNWEYIRDEWNKNNSLPIHRKYIDSLRSTTIPNYTSDMSFREN